MIDGTAINAELQASDDPPITITAEQSDKALRSLADRELCKRLDEAIHARDFAEKQLAELRDRMSSISNRLGNALDGLSSAEGYIRSSANLAEGGHE